MGENQLADIPGEHQKESEIVTIASGTATVLSTVFTAPFRCAIKEVTITPDLAVTGDTTNTYNLNIQNRGAAGIGTTEIGNLDLVTGVNLVAHDEKVIVTSLSTALLKGDVLALQLELVGGGRVIPRSVVKVKYEATEAGV